MNNARAFMGREILLGGVAAAAMLTGMVDQAFAQEAVDSSAPQVATVVVTAQRHSESIQNVPVSVQAITTKEIQSLGIKQTEDLGQIAPNLTIASPEGAGNQPLITIRASV